MLNIIFVWNINCSYDDLIIKIYNMQKINTWTPTLKLEDIWKKKQKFSVNFSSPDQGESPSCVLCDKMTLAGLWIWHDQQSCGFLTSGCSSLSLYLSLSLAQFLFACLSLAHTLFSFFALYKLSEGDKAGLISWLLSKCFPICADLYLREENVFIYHMLTCLLQAW